MIDWFKRVLFGDDACDHVYEHISTDIEFGRHPQSTYKCKKCHHVITITH